MLIKAKTEKRAPNSRNEEKNETIEIKKKFYFILSVK